MDGPLPDRIARAMAEKVVIVPYDPAWPEAFRREAAELRSCLPSDLIGRIEHFGSTAVPGLAAKPIVDMLVEVHDLAAARERIAPLLTGRGYEYFWRPTYGDDGPPWYAWFIKRDGRTGARTHHIHMVPADFEEHWDRLLVRDYLQACPEAAAEYAALKAKLVADGGGDRRAYADGKRAFLDRLTVMARGERDLTRRFDAFFAGHEGSREAFEAVRAAIGRQGPTEMRVGKSQVAFRDGAPFAWAWVPGRTLRGPRPPLVLTVALCERDPSPRWKQVVEPAPGRFVHHLELRGAGGVDGEVEGWLRRARQLASARPIGRRTGGSSRAGG